MTPLVRGLTALAIIAATALAAGCGSGSPTNASALRNTGAASPRASSVAIHIPSPSPVTSLAAFPTRLPAGGLHSEKAARVFARKLLAGVPVPKGAVLQDSLPPKPLIAGLGQGVDSKVDLDHWYTVPGSRDAAIDWVEAHSPGGFAFVENQTFNLGGLAQANPRLLSLGSDVPAHQPPGSTAVTVLRDGDHADLRVSVEVVWTPPKTRLETIPTSVRTAVLIYHRERNGTLPELRRQRTLTTTQVDQLRTLLNPIPPQPAGWISSCPESPDTATLNLAYAGQQIVFTIELGGCSDILVTADGKEQPAMRGGYKLAGPVRTLVGLPATAPS